ncbi:MAG: sigma-70 family RNA polymerase sigma factor [Planctomycetota bacterium]|nr:MAG: sigma-70 family RNA polymerase sigma factor [Planctomycetota bacterium]
MTATATVRPHTNVVNDHWMFAPAQERDQWTDEGIMLYRYLCGDEAALDDLVTMYREPAFWVSRYVVNDDEIAADVVQEAFVRILQRHERYDPQRPFKAWFLQIVRNLSIDALRRRRSAAGQDVLDGVAQEHAGFRRVEHKELRHRILDVLATLPEKYQELIRLRDVEGHGSDDIATMTGVDYGTTRWRIHQARKLFRKEWLSRYGEEVE